MMDQGLTKSVTPRKSISPVMGLRQMRMRLRTPFWMMRRLEKNGTSSHLPSFSAYQTMVRLPAPLPDLAA